MKWRENCALCSTLARIQDSAANSSLQNIAIAVKMSKLSITTYIPKKLNEKSYRLLIGRQLLWATAATCHHLTLEWSWHSESLMATLRIDLLWWLILSTKSTLPPHYQLNNSTWWLVPACQCCQAGHQKRGKTWWLCVLSADFKQLVALFSSLPPCFSGAAVSLCLTMFNVSALTCVLLLFLLCRDLFHSLQPSITAHGSARRNYLFIELLDGQEAPIRCIMQYPRIAMSKGFVVKQ